MHTSSQATDEFKRLLRNLVGSGFTVSITVEGASFHKLKVVDVVDNVAYTVSATGVVNAFDISEIGRVDF